MVCSSLSTRIPAYDPHEFPELEIAKYASSEDLTSQFRDFQKRATVFHSNPSPKDVEIAGHMRLNLAVQSEASDFDLWAQVLMVLSDGSTIQLGEAVRRARFRNSFFKEELLRPDQIVEIPFEFYWMARRIPAGARLRVIFAFTRASTAQPSPLSTAIAKPPPSFTVFNGFSFSSFSTKASWRRRRPVGQRPNWLLSPSPANNQSTLTRRRLLWLGSSGSFTDFGFWVGLFLNSSVEEELDLFIQRSMLLFSASSSTSAPGHRPGEHIHNLDT